MNIAGNRTPSQIFHEFAEYQPDRTFLIFEDLDGACRHWSFAQFDGRINQCARWLLSMDVNRETSFCFAGMNSPDFVALAIAASRIGAIMVPADYRATASELAYILDHSESRLLIAEPDKLEVTEEAASQAPNIQEIVLCGTEGRKGRVVFEEAIARCQTSPPDTPTYADDVVHMLYTSGTTSRPKGVMLTNRALVYGAEVFVRGSGLKNSDRHLITLPIFHAAAQCHAFWPSIVCGASMVVAPRFSPTRFFPLAIRHDCTMAALFSAPLRMLLNQPPNLSWRASKLRNITFAIALTDDQFHEWDQRFGVRLQHLWGMTETVGLPIMSPLYGPRDLSAMGWPVLGYDVKVVDEHDHDLPPGEVGSLVVKADPGRTVMKGYFKNAEATNEAIRNGWLFSGDNAYVDERGYFYFVDRGKDIIKRGGENLAPSEVEAAIKQIDGVADAAVVGVPDDTYDEVPWAFVIPSDKRALTADQIIAHCRSCLAPYKVPVEVRFREEFPRTSVGKIQKHLMRARQSK
jgi:crotonobetaine/carnitine-CoA ligase